MDRAAAGSAYVKEGPLWSCSEMEPFSPSAGHTPLVLPLLWLLGTLWAHRGPFISAAGGGTGLDTHGLNCFHVLLWEVLHK